jgi:hypothetical protein
VAPDPFLPVLHPTLSPGLLHCLPIVPIGQWG